MLRFLFLGYIALYAVGGIGIFALHTWSVSAEEKKDDPAWETPVDLLFSVIGLAEMLLLLNDIQIHWLEVAWRPISVAMSLIQIWGNIKAWQVWRRDADKVAVLFASIGTFVFLAPVLGH